MPRSISFFFPIFPGLCRTRSIRFVLLNYLIRTHPSRWASWSLINLILAFILTLSDCVVSVSSFSLSWRSLSASVDCLLDFVFFFYCSLRDRSWNRSESQDPILESARAYSHVQFPDITSVRILKFIWTFFEITNIYEYFWIVYRLF